MLDYKTAAQMIVNDDFKEIHDMFQGIQQKELEKAIRRRNRAAFLLKQAEKDIEEIQGRITGASMLFSMFSNYTEETIRRNDEGEKNSGADEAELAAPAPPLTLAG